MPRRKTPPSGGAVNAATSPSQGLVEDVAAGDLVVEVKSDGAIPRKLSLREKLGFGKTPMDKPTPTRKRRSTKENLLTKLLPTLLATLIATWAKDRISEEYQPCAPSHDEVSSIIGPLMDIIGRRIAVSAKVSQDAIDLTNSIICAMAYGVRAYVTYVEIKKLKERNGNTAATREPGAYQAASNGTDRDTSGVSSEGQVIEGSLVNGANDSNDPEQLRDWEAKQVADLFRRNRAGLVKLGLAAG